MRALFLALLLAVSCGGDDGGGVDAGPPDAPPGPPDATPADAPPACHTCMDILMGEGDPPLCEGSMDLFTALNTCTCAGACSAQCGPNICMNMAPTTECTMCLQDPVAGCGNEYSACAMDT